MRLSAGDDSPRPVLAHVLDYGLRLLHPIMPFVTEELWQNLREHLDSDTTDQLIVAWYPQSAGNWKDAEAEAAMAHVIEVNRTIRNLRSENRLEAGARPDVFLRAASMTEPLRATAGASEFTSRVTLTVTAPDAELPEAEYAFGRVGDTEVAVALPRVDAVAEIARLNKELEEAEAYVGRLEAQLGNAQFLSKAPEQVVKGVESNRDEARQRAAGLRERIASLQEQA